MNKEEIIAKYQTVLKELDEPAHNITMSAGSALVILGVRKQTEMINISVPDNIFNYLALGRQVVRRDGFSPYIQLDIQARAHIKDEDTGVNCVDGVWIYSLHELLRQKRQVTAHSNRLPLNKLRDEKEIRMLTAMIKEGKTTSRMV